MRVLSYILLAYLAIGLNIGLVPWLRIHETRLEIDFVLIVVSFIALFAPTPGAYLGCILIGFTQDLLTPLPLGFHALAYGLLALVGRIFAQSLYRTHPLTQFLTAGLGVFMLLIFYIAASALHGSKIDSYGSFLLGGILTIAATPVLLWPLQSQRKWFLMAKTRRN